ncbi:unnamed protein product [Lampetra planeri]
MGAGSLFRSAPTRGGENQRARLFTCAAAGVGRPLSGARERSRQAGLSAWGQRVRWVGGRQAWQCYK